MSKTIVTTIDIQKTHGFESINEDRPYNSLGFTKIHEALSFGGFSSSIGNQLDATATGNDKILRLQTGAAFIAGHFFELDGEQQITIPDVAGGQFRWDIIAARIDRSSGKRAVEIIRIEGTPSALGSTKFIPFDQLQNDELTLNSGIWEFPICAIQKIGTSNVIESNILKLLPSTNILEPFNAVEQFDLGNASQTVYRILIPNQSPINQNVETTIKVKFPFALSVIREATIVINDFDGSETPIPLFDSFGKKIISDRLKDKTVEVRIAKDKSKAIVLFVAGIILTDVIDRTDYDFEGKSNLGIYNEFQQYEVGNKFLIEPFALNDQNIKSGSVILTGYDYRTLQPELKFTATLLFKDANKITLLFDTKDLLGSAQQFICAVDKTVSGLALFEPANIFRQQDLLTKGKADQAYKGTGL